MTNKNLCNTSKTTLNQNQLIEKLITIDPLNSRKTAKNIIDYTIDIFADKNYFKDDSKKLIDFQKMHNALLLLSANFII